MHDDTSAKTLQERMGFVDRDLTTPLHDETMLWLDGEMQRWPANSLGFYAAGRRCRMTYCDETFTQDLGGHRHDPPVDALELVALKTVWVHPVRDGNSRVGFVDLAMTCRLGLMASRGPEEDLGAHGATICARSKPPSRPGRALSSALVVPHI